VPERVDTQAVLRGSTYARRAAPVVALALAASATATSPAWGTYPGANGRIVVLTGAGFRYQEQNFELLLVDPKTRKSTFLPVCAAPGRVLDVPRCWGAGGPFLSPDGQAAAVTTFGTAGPTEPLGFLTVQLNGGARSSKPIATPQPWFGVRFTKRSGPVAVRRPTSTDAEQSAILSQAAGVDWSADGWAAFASGPDPQHSDIYAGPASGPFRRMTFRGGVEPSWSPHGKWIAFQRSGAVFAVSRNGGKVRRIVAASRLFGVRYLAGTVSPVWSPDGKRIAFYRAAKRGETTYLDLYVVDRKSRKVRRLATALTSDDSYDDSTVDSLTWQPLPRP
jgi:hypothetical protein